ncbi:MAG: hypothetical protein GY856_29165 [bacterium]|nr:hypothetical protein [bacterium]
MLIVRSYARKGPGGVLRRRLALSTGLALALLLAPVARSDVFVMKLVPPPSGDKPTIEVGGVPIVIDTGASSGLSVNPATATALGMDPNGGRPARIRGVGGTTPARAGVPVPGGVGPSGASTPITPGGQTATSPTMPGTGNVRPSATSSQGLLGSGWLAGFEYGRIDGYFWLVAKDQGAEGVATAIAMASFLGLPPAMDSTEPKSTGAQATEDAVQSTDDFFGRPPGTRSAILTPTPPKNLPPDVLAADEGWQLDVDLIDPATGMTAVDVPFVIKSGLDMTLISESLALELGLDPDTLPEVDTPSNFGTMTVRQATLELVLFDDPGFPTFAVAVGVTDSATNPFAENFIAGDILSLLIYWELSAVKGDGLTRLFAAVATDENSGQLQWPKNK